MFRHGLITDIHYKKKKKGIKRYVKGDPSIAF